MDTESSERQGLGRQVPSRGRGEEIAGLLIACAEKLGVRVQDDCSSHEPVFCVSLLHLGIGSVA